jgi:hypothetical protein
MCATGFSCNRASYRASHVPRASSVFLRACGVVSQKWQPKFVFMCIFIFIMFRSLKFLLSLLVEIPSNL